MDERIRKLNPQNKEEMEEAKEYIGMVVEEMANKYGFSEKDAVARMETSGFTQQFEDDPYFYFHYQPEDTAEMIFNSKVPQKH